MGLDIPPCGLPEGTASLSLQMEVKNLSFFIKKDVTSSNKCLCELLKATLFISVGDDFSNSCVHKILVRFLSSPSACRR